MTGNIYCCKGISSSSSSTSKHPGHNICSDCEWQMRRLKSDNGHIKTMECPICKVRGPFTRNKSLERQLLDLSQPCAHAAAGCKERFFPWDDTRNVHEKYLCPFQSVDCPFCYQSIPGGRANFVEHLNKSTANPPTASPCPPAASSNVVADIDSGNHDDSDSDYFPSPNVSSEDETDVDIQDESDSADPNEALDQKSVSVAAAPTVPPCLLHFHELAATSGSRQIVGRDRNEFMVNSKLGIAFCFIAPTDDCPCWKSYALSIDPRHSLTGNSRVYLQYADHDRFRNCNRKEAAMGSGARYITPPPMHTLTLQLSRLHPSGLRRKFNSYPAINPLLESNTKPAIKSRQTMLVHNAEMKECDIDDTESDTEMANDQEDEDLDEYEPAAHLGHSPCSQIQCEFIYGGNASYGQQAIQRLNVRVFTLEQSLKVGCIIDARDFRGEWFEASVIIIQDSDGKDFMQSDCISSLDVLDIRRAKIHYLGYSGSYDEWIDIDTDSHRLAHRGTFTVGPNLRQIRKNSAKVRRARSERTAVMNRRRIAAQRADHHDEESVDEDDI